MSLVFFAALLAAYFVVVGLIGWKTSKGAKHTSEDFYLASRGVGLIALTLTLAATILSSLFYLGIAGSLYSDGLPFLFGLVLWQLFTVAGMLYVGPRVWRLGKTHGYVTPSAVAAGYYSDSRAVRSLATAVFVVAAFPYLVLQMRGAGLALNSLTDGKVSVASGIAGFTVVAMAYVLAGGVRAVVWTDVMQGAYFLGLLVIIAALTIFVIAPDVSGGWDPVLATTPDAYNFPGPSGEYGWQLLISLVVFTGIANVGQPAMIQRFLMSRSSQTVSTSAILYGLLVIPVALLIGYIAFVAAGSVEPSSPDMLFPEFIEESMPVLSAFFLVGVIAAGMSTVDSLLLTLSSMVHLDVAEAVIKRRQASDRTVALGRIFVVIMGGGAYLLSLRTPAGLAELAILMIGWVGCVLVVIVAPMMWSRPTKEGAIAALTLGPTAVAVTTFAYPSPLGFNGTFWGIAASVAALAVVSVVTTRRSAVSRSTTAS